MEVDRELLSPQEAARRLSLGKTRLYELLGSGAIPSVRVGKLRRIPTRALRDYVDRLVTEQVGIEVDGTAEAIDASSRVA
jgi:excisionase family DNA binding protein